jgi:methionine aminopeptidase
MPMLYGWVCVAIRLLREGRKNHEITEALAQVAAAFHCRPLEGVLSHNLRRYVLDGPRVVLGRADADSAVDEVVFAPGDVFAIDVVMSTGEGKTRAADERTTVYRRNVDTTYSLKMKGTSRAPLR